MREMVFLEGDGHKTRVGEYQIAESTDDLIVMAQAGYYPRGLKSAEEVAALPEVKKGLIKMEEKKKMDEYKEEILKRITTELKNKPEDIESKVQPSEDDIEDALQKQYVSEFPNRRPIRDGKDTENYKQWKQERNK